MPIKTFEIAASGDDGHCYIGGSGFSTAWDSMVLGNYSGNGFHNYFRFLNVTIPAKATIIDAFIRFTSYNTMSSSGVANNLYFEDADNPTQPASGTDLNARPLTDAVAWNDPAAWTDGSTYDSPDLTDILQDVIDRAGWQSGNAVTGHGIDNGSPSGSLRSPSSHDYSPAEAAELHVEYSTGEQTALEDISLDLAAYYQKQEDLASFLRAHDGVEFRDLLSQLAAFLQTTEDLPVELSAYYEELKDLGVYLETWATQYKDLAGDFDAKGQSIESLMSRFETAKSKYKNLATFLSVTDGITLKSLAAFLSVTDGSVLNNLGLYLKAVQSVPAFRSITAQRVSSVVHEVS